MRKEVRMAAVIAVILFISSFGAIFLIDHLPKEEQNGFALGLIVVFVVLLTLIRISHGKPLIED